MPEIQKTPESTQILARLDAIEQHLSHLDRRDRTRMITTTIKGFFNLAMLAIVAGSSYYLFANLGEIIRTIARETAQQTFQQGKTGSEDFMKQLQEMFRGNNRVTE